MFCGYVSEYRVARDSVRYRALNSVTTFTGNGRWGWFSKVSSLPHLMGTLPRGSPLHERFLFISRPETTYIYYGKATEAYCDAPGVTTVKRNVVGLIVVCAVLLWAVSPIFVGSPGNILTLTVNPSTNSDCPSESACFTLEFQNRGPWPVAIDIVELRFYPSLIGPSVNANYLGAGPDRFLMLMPFTGQTYTFGIRIMGGLRAPDRIYAVLAANVRVLYVSHHMVLHSGKR